jgi:AAA domain
VAFTFPQKKLQMRETMDKQKKEKLDCLELSILLSGFYPDDHEPIHLRAFAPKKAPSGDSRFNVQKIIVTRHELATDHRLQERLCKLNATRGLYFVVNSGGDVDTEITRFNAWFVEDDSRPIEEQQRRLDAAPLPPSIRVETRQSVHAYWLIIGSCTTEEWRDIQHRLIAYFGGDEKIKNPSRVMRLPFFNHVHFDKESGKLSFKRVVLKEFMSERRYTVAEMQAAFPPVSELEPRVEEIANTESQGATEFASWDELHAETTRRIRLSPKARTNRKGWTHAPGICHRSVDGTALVVSPDGAYKCHKGCSTAQVRAVHGLPERPNTSEPETRFSDTQPKAVRVTSFTFTTLKDLLTEPDEEVAYVWDKTLPRGGFSICAAKPKVGKSTLVRNLAVAVSRGAEFFGRATMRGKVIYLCLEEKRAEVAAHFRRMGANEEGIIIHTGRTPTDVLDALEKAIEEHSPVLIIIDPLSRFGGIREFNDYGDVTRGLEPLIDLARSSECQPHILTVHHNGKMEREGGDGLLGSTGFFGAVDTLLTMKRRERVRTLESMQRYGEDLPETVVHLEAQTGLVLPGGDMQDFLLMERKAAVIERVGDEVLAEGDIKERIGGKSGLTSKALRALFEEGVLERIGAGKKGDPYLYKRRSDQTQEAY